MAIVGNIPHFQTNPNNENVWKCLKKLDDIGRRTPSVSSLDFPPSATNSPLSPRLFGFTLHMQRVTAFAATFSRDSLVQHRFWCLCWPCWSLQERRRSMRPDQIEQCFFFGAWVLYTSLGYLRSVYAGLRRMEGRLRRSTWQQIAYASAYASLFDCCAKVRRLKSLMTKKKRGTRFRVRMWFQSCCLSTLLGYSLL